ncbi:hypothetical protein EVAR_199_1 [Eumeta japonica]|uniref:Uncharacterized protein n=1 Tax=Eumeta variegata TaxID=151549 RepID=A0A4C1S9X2_EUMVA|nr:hypothetical protein EVAR_199_1 [Eumeta japonica]
MKGFRNPVSASDKAVKPHKTVVVGKIVTAEDTNVEEEKLQVDEVSKEESSVDEEYLPDGKTKVPETFNREELNDLV